MRFMLAFLAVTAISCGSGKGKDSSKESPQATPAPEAPKPKPPEVYTPPSIPSVISYPKTPDVVLTPGSLCSIGETFRYTEAIRYCDRDVASAMKNSIIETYDRTFGYSIAAMPREDFKIDHYIPLCMGGSNELDNLWPQHQDTFALTDKVEASLCNLMSKDRMLQADAVELVKWVKFNFSESNRLLEALSKVMNGTITSSDVSAEFLNAR